MTLLAEHALSDKQSISDVCVYYSWNVHVIALLITFSTTVWAIRVRFAYISAETWATDFELAAALYLR